MKTFVSRAPSGHAPGGSLLHSSRQDFEDQHKDMGVEERGGAEWEMEKGTEKVRGRGIRGYGEEAQNLAWEKGSRAGYAYCCFHLQSAQHCCHKPVVARTIRLLVCWRRIFGVVCGLSTRRDPVDDNRRPLLRYYRSIQVGRERKKRRLHSS